MADERETDAPPPGAEGRAKLPYSPPEITWQEPLEDRPHLIAACAQTPGRTTPATPHPRAERRLRLAPELAWQMIDGEGVMVDLPRGCMLGLSPSASLIWSRIGTSSEERDRGRAGARFEVERPGPGGRAGLPGPAP